MDRLRDKAAGSKPRLRGVAQITLVSGFVPIGCRPGIGTVTLSYRL
jgi:hypothetical protein